MKGGKNKSPLGYTIIEVMIVLAISGVMFLIAADFVNGKEQRTAFTDGVNTLASNIQDVIEQIGDGNYSNIPITCLVKNGSLAISNPALTAPTPQGTNSDCVFLGKVFFWPTPAQNPDDQYYLYTMAGSSTNPTATISTGEIGLSDISYAPVYVKGSSGVDLTVSQETPEALQISGIDLLDSTGAPIMSLSPIYAFGLIQSLGSNELAAGTNATHYESGAQTINLYYVPNTVITSGTSGSNQIAGANALNYNASSTNNNPLVPVLSTEAIGLCVTDGTHSSVVSIGGANASQLSVNIENGSQWCHS
jgi:prepilin-type N-terminal cleavage/methylation domain-containing protein